MGSGGYWPPLALALLMLAIATVAASPTEAQDKVWVTADTVNRRSCPDTACPIVGRLYFREAAEALERHGNWVRVSKYYVDPGCAFSGRADYVREGDRSCSQHHGYRADGAFAEWIHADFLSAVRPKPKPQPKFTAELMDPRIQGIPEVGEGGNTERDILILRKGALKLLKSGRCSLIEYGDRSTNRQGYYFVYCGSSQNIYFTAADVE